MSGKFTAGIISGMVAGMAVFYYALDCMRPDVTSKMMRNGKKMAKYYKKHMFSE